MRFNNPILINAQTNTGTVLSIVVDGSQLVTGSFQATFTDSSAAGTLLIQGSNDPIELLPAGEVPQNWFAIPNASATVSSGAITPITIATLNYRWIRVKWTQSGGAGTLTVVGFFLGLN